MYTNSDYLSNNYENLCGNISKDILNEATVNISNESKGIIKVNLNYTLKNEKVQIQKDPVIIFVKETNKIIIPYNATYISLIFYVRNHNEEWVRFEEQTYFDPQNKSFIVSGDIDNLLITEI